MVFSTCSPETEIALPSFIYLLILRVNIDTIFLIWFPITSSLLAQMIKCLPTMWETQVRSLDREDPLEKEMAMHSSTLAWKIPWMEEPGRLQSMGSLSRTRLSDFTSLLHPLYDLRSLKESSVVFYVFVSEVVLKSEASSEPNRS